MAVFVRNADLFEDRPAIVDLHQKFLTSTSSEKRFEWLYCQNPYGLPKVWIAQDEESGEIVGTAAAFPRGLRIGSKKEVGWVLGDFCISDAYRSLGPALQLQRTCLEQVRSGTDSIWYDFPSHKMLAVYKRLKISSTRNMIRFVKPLRVNRRVQAIVKGEALQKGLSFLGNVALNLTAKRVHVKQGMIFSYHKEQCGDEFTALSDEMATTNMNCLERSATYLNWRYHQNPMYSSEFITARFMGVLKGYIVFSEMEGDALILDVFGSHEDDVMLGLIVNVLDRIRERGHESLSVSMVEGHNWIPFFVSLGFSPRDTDPVIIQTAQCGSTTTSYDCGSPSLLLMQGDRDA